MVQMTQANRESLALYFCGAATILHDQNREFATNIRRTRLESQDDAMLQKKERIERLLRAINEILMHCLKNGENIWPMFAEATNRMLTNTSKRVPEEEKISFLGHWSV